MEEGGRPQVVYSRRLHDSPVLRGGWPGWTASGHSTSRHGEGWGLPIQGHQFLEIEARIFEGRFGGRADSIRSLTRNL
ncbi:hypothetical protein CRG98_006551 [Punica granatum]|uniref:Uncharacterized protein n=1 Tax=Punica granatum TaxID=22663 RepID=A0A2I0KYX7_PUNGR|nr:hypothetical protein CRG98_006551 [Punica granatum]